MINVNELKSLYYDLLYKTIITTPVPEKKRYLLVDGTEWFDHYGTHYECDGKIKAGDKCCNKCGAVLEWEELIK